jgi:uncharacterized protein (TIGR03437 family)
VTPESTHFRQAGTLVLLCLLLVAAAGQAVAAPPDRITQAVETGRVRAISGSLHRAAQRQFDRGAVDPQMPMDYIMLIVKPSAAQQAELDALLAAQQNSSSPLFHRWLSPEQFGERFGLSSGDQARVAAWLASEGLTVNESARGGNWIAFSGRAGAVSKALRVPIHRFVVDAEEHFANATEPSVPEALADVVGGFLGLDDFHPQPFARLASNVVIAPDYNSGLSHYLAPEDYATIYDIAPLYAAGLDGTGQGIAIVGQSDVLLNDLRAFRTRYGLPANDPKFVLYTGTNPGFNSAQIEGNLDLEWAAAIAPSASLFYVYGPSALAAMVAAINMNYAPVISVSYGNCEIDFSPSFYRSIAQQANAQGITILSASGDSGAAGCDTQQSEPLATRGRMTDFPAVLPEVTGVGGTELVEGSGKYWSQTNSPDIGSALGYIPEASWNESSTAGLGATGGGASLFYPRPAWQTGPGVPLDNARHVPDVAMSAAIHDAYLVTYQGANIAVGGTSASAPSLAGIVALLNQYQVSQGFQAKPGLGNINPQLYRLAQSVPAAFHDIATGTNIVACAQGSPDCLNGSFGYAAAPGYDMATGLGSIDANVLVTEWNTQSSAVTVTLASPSQVTLNDMVTATAIVAPAGGSGAPSGTVAFSINGTALGTAPVVSGTAQNTADLTFPVYRLGAGLFALSAVYSGDSVYSGGGAVRPILITAPAKAAAIVPAGPAVVWASGPDAQGLSWQTTLSLREAAGVPAMITGFAIDGVAQSLAQYFPSPQIPASGTVRATVVFRNLATPLTRTFGFTGVDAAGQTWSRQISVDYFSMPAVQNFNLTATPLIVVQNPAADPSCQWAARVQVDDLGGYATTVTALYAGSVNLSAQIAAIFGTTRLEAWGSLAGTVCFSGIVPPASDFIEVDLSSGVAQEVAVAFAGPPAVPVKISATPAAISLPATSNQPTQAKLAIDVSDKTQPWTAAVFPANRTTAWLSVSPLSGTGPAQITLTASGAGFEPGAYRAVIVIQSANAVPQSISVPVMFLLGGSGSTTAISAVANPATYRATASPGMLLSVFGSNLANTTVTASGNPLSYTLAGVRATVNGVAAPLIYVSPNQINLQVPYTVGAGPAVLGLDNNGQIAGFAFEIAPSAPGVFADSDGNLVPRGSAPQGGVATLYVNGIGEVSPVLRTAFTPSPALAPINLPKPVLPLSVTVGGVPAFLQFVGIGPSLVGAAQVNFTVPASVPPGPQPVVVTVGGVASPPVNLTVQPPPPVNMP